MISVNSEIGRLKKVLLHYPGEELNNLTPKYLEELLFDDIPWLPLAKKEHEAFANAFREAGVEVVYLEDLVAEVLCDDNVKQEFIHEFVSEANIHSETLKEVVVKYLSSFTSPKELVLKTMAGIKKDEIDSYKKTTLTDFVFDTPFICNPMPNLYFTRDPFASIYNGVSLNKMYSITRSRETIYGKFIFKYHKDFKDTPKFYDRDYELNIEGGDILVLNKETLIIGVSERTHPGAIERLAKNMFYKFDTSLKRILAFSIPKMRTFMHLDTVFTQLDYDKFAIHKECYDNLVVYEVCKDKENFGKLKTQVLNESLENILGTALGKTITLIPCGGEDMVSAAREQWSDGSNTIAIAPGEVIAYERNDLTNKALKENGIKVHTIPSSELSRGRGGPRCMCMPLERD